MFHTLPQWLTRSLGRLAGRGARGVFINYRRSDSERTATDLNERLRGKLGGQDVFYDVETIPPGKPFPEVIVAGIRSARVVLVLIGETWHDTRDTDGALRLQQEKDFVRREIELATRENKFIIPVLIDGAKLHEDDQRLPESLRFIGTLNAVKVQTGTGKYRDMDDLIAVLRQHGVSPSWRHWARHNRAGVAFGSLVVMLILAAGGALLAGIPQAWFSPGTAAVPPVAAPETKPGSPLLKHLSVKDKTRLKGATVSSVVQIAGMCEDETIQQLAVQHQDEPAVLLNIITTEYLK